MASSAFTSAKAATGKLQIARILILKLIIFAKFQVSLTFYAYKKQ